MPTHATVTPIVAGLHGCLKSSLAWGPILHRLGTQNSLQLSYFPRCGETGHSQRLSSFTLFARPQIPQAGIWLREVKPRTRRLLRAVCKHLGFLYRRQIPFPILRFANLRQAAFFEMGNCLQKAKVPIVYSRFLASWTLQGGC